MPPIWQVQRTAAIAFAPDAPYLVTGSYSGAVDSSFSTDSTLQIYSADVASSNGGQLPHVGGSVKASESFERVTWGAMGLNPAQYPSGLIAGGLADGTVGVWSPDRILAAAEGAEDVPEALVTTLTGHAGPVRGLDLNQGSPNLLASGSTDGETLVWDLNAAEPSSYKVGGSSSSGMNSRGGARPEVGAVAWNWKFPFILACGLSSGTCLMWDLKDKPKPVVSLRHPAGPRRLSALQWSPGDAWHIMISSDDDMSPELQLWDLRNQREPKATLHGHSAGVLGLSWCPQDPAFLLSSSKDNRTIVWDTESRQEMLELPRSGGCNFNAAWSPRISGMFATASFDGKVSVYGLETAAQPDTASAAGGDFAALLSTQSTEGPPKPLSRTPAWLKRPVSGVLGFGGKLAVLTHARESDQPNAPLKLPYEAHVEVKQVITEQGLVQASEEFNNAAHGDRPTLRDFCAQRAAAATAAANEASSEGAATDSRMEAETWTFLRILFEDNASEELLKHLGFSDMLPGPPPTSEPSAEESLASAQDTLGQLAVTSPTGQPGTPPAPVASAPSGEDFFSALGGAGKSE